MSTTTENSSRPVGRGVSGGGRAGGASGRVVWADVAKGMSIIGVCLMHVVTGYPDGMATTWGFFSSVLDPVRMPLFFLVSGFFSHRVLERSLGELWHRRLWFLLVPYVVFTPWHARQVLHGFGAESVTPWELVRAVVTGEPGLWFLHALILYTLAAWALRRFPPWAAVAVSVLPLFVAAATGAVMHPAVRQLVVYAPAFFLGLHLRPALRRLADSAHRPAVVVVTLALFVGWEMVYRPVDLYFIADGFTERRAAVSVLLALVRSVAAVPFGVVVAVWLGRTPVVSRVLSVVGRNTLPVYVSHLGALIWVRGTVVPWLVDRDPGRWGVLLDVNPSMVLGLVTCAGAGLALWAVGEVPYLRWVL
ncbi:acyltransferase family protein, partial [Corynebacterium bovis]